MLQKWEIFMSILRLRGDRLHYDLSQRQVIFFLLRPNKLKLILNEIVLHCRMRRQSSCFVMATNQNSDIGVFFNAEFNFWVQIPDFRWAHQYKITKNPFSGSQDQKFLFTGSSLRHAERGQFCPCFLANHANGAWLQSITLFLVYQPERWPSKHNNIFRVPTWTQAFKTKKKCNLPAFVQTKTTLLKPFLIGLTGISTSWRCPKIWTKKVRKFFWNS